jgi:hypothetical protein
VATNNILPATITGLEMSSNFVFHFGGPCLTTIAEKNVTLEFIMDGGDSSYSCSLDIPVIHGPASSVQWLQYPPTKETIIVGIPLSPSPSVKFVDSYGNQIYESSVVGKSVDVKLVAQSAKGNYGLMGVTTATMKNGVATFEDLITTGLLDNNPSMNILVETTPAFITPPPVTIKLQYGVPVYIVVQWTDKEVMIDKCTSPATVRIPEKKKVHATVDLTDFFGNKQPVGLCSSTTLPPCINITSTSDVLSNVVVTGKHTFELDTNNLDTNSSQLIFNFPQNSLTNITYFAVYSSDRLNCFPDIIFQDTCATSMNTIDQYFINKMVSIDKHQLVVTKFKSTDKSLLILSNKFAGYNKIYKEHDTTLNSMSLTGGPFFTHLGYNYTRFWSMNSIPDYMDPYYMTFNYPFCSAINTLTLDGVNYESKEFQKLVFVRWLANITASIKDQYSKPKFSTFCHSRENVITKYLKIDQSTTCCFLAGNNQCVHQENTIERISTALYAIQFVVAILGTIYALGLFFTKYRWKSWEKTRAIYYEVPIMKSWKHSEHIVTRVAGFVVQRFFSTLAGCSVSVIFWSMCLAMLIKNSVLEMTVPLFVILSVTIILWVLASVAWYIIESLYRHEFFSTDLVLVWGERFYFVAIMGNILVGAFVAFMFVSWTSLGFIMDPARVAPVFSAVVFIMYVDYLSILFVAECINSISL